jgi:hypothetical protein
VKEFATLLLALLLSGCAGYHLGPAVPAYLQPDPFYRGADVPERNALPPRVEVAVTGTVIKQFQQDGTSGSQTKIKRMRL